MKKLLTFLLFNTLFFASYTAYAPKAINSSPKPPPQVLWTVKGVAGAKLRNSETTVALAFWAALKPDFIYVRIEEGIGKGKIKGYESALDRTKTLEALKNGTFPKLYKDSPSHFLNKTVEEAKIKREFLNKTIEEAFEGKNKNTKKLKEFCKKVTQVSTE